MVFSSEIRRVVCEREILEYQLIRKDVKNINLRIKPDGKILISANNSVPEKIIDDFIKRKQKYIIQSLERNKENQRYVSMISKQYVSGESFDIIGKSLRLKVIEKKKDAVWTDGVFLYLAVKDKNNLIKKQRIFDTWLKELQWKTFEQIIWETYQTFKKYDVPYPKLKIRYMTSRWGSCQPKRGSITLNSRLIEAPRNCIEYVVLHEYVHFLYPNHSSKFYEFLSILMPDWKERKTELEKRL